MNNRITGQFFKIPTEVLQDCFQASFPNENFRLKSPEEFFLTSQTVSLNIYEAGDDLFLLGGFINEERNKLITLIQKLAGIIYQKGCRDFSIIINQEEGNGGEADFDFEISHADFQE